MVLVVVRAGAARVVLAVHVAVHPLVVVAGRVLQVLGVVLVRHSNDSGDVLQAVVVEGLLAVECSVHAGVVEGRDPRGHEEHGLLGGQVERARHRAGEQLGLRDRGAVHGVAAEVVAVFEARAAHVHGVALAERAAEVAEGEAHGIVVVVAVVLVHGAARRLRGAAQRLLHVSARGGG